jgi:hypothetical protein
MANCLEYELPFKSEEEELLHHACLSDHLYVMAKSAKGQDKNEDVVLPLRVTIGVTMSLIGLFLYVVPFPICKAAAPWVLDTGIAFLIDQGLTEWEKEDK